MIAAVVLGAGFALAIVLISFVQLLYLEALRLRSREQPALTRFKENWEDRIGLPTDEGALAFSLVKHGLLLAGAILIYLAVSQDASKGWARLPHAAEAAGMAMVAMIALAHISPQLLLRRTSGAWLEPLIPLVRLAALPVRPLIALLRFLESLSSLSDPSPNDDASASASDDIEALITAGAEEGLIEEDDRKLIQSVVEFGDKTVRQVMTPRPNMVAVEENETLAALHQLVVREQYSRLPTFRGHIDAITGFVHVRDLYEIDSADRGNRTVAGIRRDITLVPETKPVDDLLRMMQKSGDHMVVVVDEYGQVAGLATMEDLVEEIVGEIRDEHEPSQDLEKQADGSYVVSGNLDIDHLFEMFEIRLTEETESTTIGGLATEWFGKVPQSGESIERSGLRLEVMASDLRRVSQVRLRRVAVKEPNGENGKH